ncbi:MAG: hypothetical protein J6A16_03675, partial [Oscillospiraceae bacterium]|nr:hypothetical protein [Oscillospiraceae bacterium]
MAVVAEFHLSNGCVGRIHDDFYANRTPEQKAADRKLFEGTVQRLWSQAIAKKIEQEMAAKEAA